MKVSFKLIALCAVTILGSTAAYAAADSGKIVEVYAHPSGQMALRLDGGVPNSNATNNCGHTGGASSQFAGVTSTDASSIKSAILAAKAANSTVTLVTLGNCIGAWIKIEAMSIN